MRLSDARPARTVSRVPERFMVGSHRDGQWLYKGTFTGAGPYHNTRLASNIIVWLVNIEKRVAENRTASVKDERNERVQQRRLDHAEGACLGLQGQVRGGQRTVMPGAIVADEGTTCVLDIVGTQASGRTGS